MFRVVRCWLSGLSWIDAVVEQVGSGDDFNEARFKLVLEGCDGDGD